MIFNRTVSDKVPRRVLFTDETKNGLQTNVCNPLILMARRGRFELPTF